MRSVLSMAVCVLVFALSSQQAKAQYPVYGGGGWPWRPPRTSRSPLLGPNTDLSAKLQLGLRFLWDGQRFASSLRQ